MCFAPQRRAFVQHLNFQKCSGRELLLSLLTSTGALRHNGVQFFISHLPRWLRTRRFSEPTFRPSGALKQCFATFLPFAHLDVLSTDSFSSDSFSAVSFSSLAALTTVAASVHKSEVFFLNSKLPWGMI